MTQVFGNPAQPCAQIRRSHSLIDTIAKEARRNAENDLADPVTVEAGLSSLRAEAIENLGLPCSQLCPKYGRCMLANFGPDDPLFPKASAGNLSPDETTELKAKRFLDMLGLLCQEALGIV